MRSRAPLIALLAAVVLAVAFWFLLYNPKSEEQAALEAETAQLQQQASQLQSEIAQLEEVKANRLEIRAALARLEEYIPRGETGQPAALREFQLAADAAGVEITSLTFEQPEPVLDAPETDQPETALARIPVTMIAEGGYFQQVDLLRRLEVDTPRALLIDSITVAEGEAGFPALATTWTGGIFSVIPVTQEPEPTPAPGSSEVPAEDEAPPASPAPADPAQAAPSP